MQVPGEVLRGGSTSGAPSELPLFLSPRGGWGYPVSLRGGSTSGAPPLRSPFFSPRGGWGYPVSLRGGSTSGAPPLRSPHGWAYPAHTRGSFRFTTKGTKGVPGLPPLDPERGARCPPCGGAVKRRATPPMGVSDTTKDRFAHPLQADKPVFCSPAVSSREHFWLLICGAGNLRCKMSKSLDILHLSVLY